MFTARIQQLRLKHLRLLELVFETGTLRQAAAQLHTTQPAATLLLREIETALGLPLFERHRRGLRPTAQALLLRPRLTQTLHALEALQDEASDIAADGHVQLRLGCLPRSMQTLMPGILLELVERSPRLRIVLRESTTDTLLRELQAGQLDCMIGRLLPDTGLDEGVALDYRTLYEDGLCFIAARGHPLARRRRLTLAQLREERWVLPPPGSMARRAFQDEFINVGLAPPTATIESAAFLSNMNLVAHGEVLSISPRSAAELRSRAGDIRVLPYRLATALPPISLIWRRGEMASGPLRLLQALLAKVLVSASS